VIEDKQQQRKQTLARRDAMAFELRERLSSRLVACADLVMRQSTYKVIAGFWPMRSEIDPRALMKALAQNGAKLALPALIDTEQGQRMVFRAFQSDKDLVPMGFNTFGPSEKAPRLDPDLILLPLAAFDKQGNRIGYGGGFYDRTIAWMRERSLTPKLIGLAFDCQEVVAIAAEPHDIRLEAILTESGLRRFGKVSACETL